MSTEIKPMCSSCLLHPPSSPTKYQNSIQSAMGGGGITEIWRSLEAKYICSSFWSWLGEADSPWERGRWNNQQWQPYVQTAQLWATHKTGCFWPREVQLGTHERWFSEAEDGAIIRQTDYMCSIARARWERGVLTEPLIPLFVYIACTDC